MERIMVNANLDEQKLMELTGKVFENVSAAGSLLIAYLGDQAGVYTAIDEHGPCSAEVLASKTNLDERYLLEWLSSNAAMGYIPIIKIAMNLVYLLNKQLFLPMKVSPHVCRVCFKE